MSLSHAGLSNVVVLVLMLVVMVVVLMLKLMLVLALMLMLLSNVKHCMQISVGLSGGA